MTPVEFQFSSKPQPPLPSLLLHPQVQAFIQDLQSPFDPIILPEKFKKFATIVILGIGGPALCGRILLSASQSICETLNQKYDLSSDLDNRPLLKNMPFSPSSQTSLSKQTILFQDNLSTINHTWLKSQKDLSNVGVLILSKSGETLETLLETQDFITVFQNQNLPLEEHFIVATEGRHSTLLRLASLFGLPLLDLSPHIDGRFSLFSKTGQIISSLLDFPMDLFRQGAISFLQHIEEKNAFHDLKALHRYQNLLQEHVIWVYDEKLIPLAEWCAQLIGESLGKEGNGLTPIIAVGPKDQHSQLQLYLGGPRNKFFTFLHTSTTFEDIIKSATNTRHEVNFAKLQHIHLCDIIGLQMHSVMEILHENDIPLRHIHIDLNNPFYLGKICMRIILEIWTLGFMRSIDPFGQPNVEKFKQKMMDLLQRL